MPATTTFALSGNPYIDGVLGDRKWAVNSFTYSFPASASFYGSPYGSNEPSNGFAQLNASQQAAARAALAMYASVANLSFAEITESSVQHADIRLALSSAGSTAWAYFPTTAAEGGDAWFNPTKYTSPTKGNYQYTTFIHELGHSLGLEHPHTGGMPADRDSMEYSVMSYRSYIGGSTTSGYTNETWGFAQSLMMNDIAAIQHLYGANFNTNAGNTTYSWSPATGEIFINGIGQGAPGGNKIFQTVWDGGGTDTYDFSNYSTNLSIDLRPGQWSTVSNAQLARLHYSGSEVADGNIANALQHQGDVRSLIENAVGGSADDSITGNMTSNTISGGSGNDVLTGMEGDDVLVGGEGSDTAVYRGVVSNYSVVATATGYLVTDGVGGRDGADTLQSIELLRFADASFGPSVLASGIDLLASLPGWTALAADFNGDHTDDILWRSRASGGVDLWTIDENEVAASRTLVPALGGWFVAAVGDLTGDGTDDILWREVATGRTDVWAMQDGGVLRGSALVSSLPGWTVAGVADFNNDGTGDILWREDSTGRTDVWLMQNGGVLRGSNLVAALPGWTVAGLDDFNGDGTADILWRESSSGRTDIWAMRDGGILGGSNLVGAFLGWSIVGIGDFNSDDTADLVWREDATGRMDVWYLQNSRPSGGVAVPSSLRSWSVETVGDFNGDGRDDLLLVNGSGVHASFDFV